ncbi:MAG TPA: NUDIX hydrolase [Aeromicrobium sp.]|nr:NUDIX hydrolase [Aeromicrobium sp.]
MTEHPDLTGTLADGRPLTDTAATWPVATSTVVHDSPYAQVRTDVIVDPTGGEHARLVVRPNGAVGVLALDVDDRVLLVQQYRHPVGQRMLELPAGTLDVVGESNLDAARRELAEEADVVAESWSSLLHAHASPGYSGEAWEVFLAEGLSPLPVEQRTVRRAEEADMDHWWLPFDEALDAVAAGRITDAMTVAGLLALHARRTR